MQYLALPEKDKEDKESHGQKNRSPKLLETIPQDGEMDEYMHLLWLNGL